MALVVAPVAGLTGLGGLVWLDVLPLPGETVPVPDVGTAPATDEPVTEPPVTEPPVTEPPVTGPPVEPTPDPTVEPTVEPTPEPTATVEKPAPTATSTAPVWTTPPTVTTSTMPVGVLVIAVLVLVLAAAALVVLHRRLGPARRAAGATGGVLPAGDAPTGVLSAGDAPTGVLSPGDAPTGVLPQQRPSPTADATAGVVPAVVAAAGADAATVVLPAPSAGPADTLRFLVVLGEAMIDTTAPVAQVQDSLQRVAAVNGLPDLEVVALPTALFVSVPSAPEAGTAAVSTGHHSLRLDQVQDVLEVVDAAEHGEVGPAEGTAAVLRSLASTSPYPVWQRLTGYVLTAAGLSLVLGGTFTDLIVAAVLALAVAASLRVTGRWSDSYQGFVALGAAFAVSVAVFSLSRTGLDLTLLAPLVSPLVTFLPGAVLTTAAIDLATRQMVAGAARLASGVMTLVLLGLGIVGGANLVGIPASVVVAANPTGVGAIGPWIGVLVFGVGVTWRFSARRSAVPWILITLVVAYAGQLVGGLLLGSQLSAFVGAFVMTPVAMAAAQRPTGPPPMVTFLPGFWLLVPGALSLVGVTSFLGNSLDQGIAAVITAGTTMVTISLGVLAGLGVGGWLLSVRQALWTHR